MPLPPDYKFTLTVDDPATLPPEAKALYIKGEDGKHVLDPVMAKILDVSPLNKALEKERTKAKELDRTVAAFRALGFGDTPEDVKKTIDEKLAELDPKDPDDKKKIIDLKAMREKLKGEFDATLAKTVSAKDEEISKMKRSLQKNMVEREAIAALAKHKGSPELLLPILRDRVALVEEDGELQVRVLDKDGEPESDGRGGFKSVDALVAEMRADEKYARAFDGTGRTGSGARPGERGKGVSTGGDMTPIGRIAAGLSGLKNRR